MKLIQNFGLKTYRISLYTRTNTSSEGNVNG
jgi:hypothetical protein